MEETRRELLGFPKGVSCASVEVFPMEKNRC